MRWSIRNQILLPFLGVVLLAVGAMTVAAAIVAAQQRDQQTLWQLQNVLATLEQTSVPLHAGVLEKLHGLSGAQFIACDRRGQVVATTLDETPELPTDLQALPVSRDFDSLAGQPACEIAGVRYFSARLEPRGDEHVRSLYVLYPVAERNRARWAAALPPLAVGGGATLLTAAVSAWLAQRFGSRIRRLQQQVAAIAAGDFTRIPLAGRSDEIQELVGSVNQLSEQLQQLQDTIRRTERERLLAQLAGGLAHQLRNAVTGARMALQLHQRRCTASPQDNSLQVALRQLSLTETQIKGLLSLGRAEGRECRLTDLSQQVAEVAQLLEPACEHACVALHVDLGHGPLVVQADAESLRAAVLNLATNAIEAAGASGTVTLTTRAAPGAVVLEIADTGVGPAAAIAASLFDPFVTTKPEGVGLGLSLTRQVALDHGGRVSWHRDQNRTVFRLELPATPPDSLLKSRSSPRTESAVPCLPS